MAKPNADHVDNSPPTIPNHLKEADAVAAAAAGSWEVDALITQMETELEAAGGQKKGFFQLEFSNPKYFTWLVVTFASMGGLVSHPLATARNAIIRASANTQFHSSLVSISPSSPVPTSTSPRISASPIAKTPSSTPACPSVLSVVPSCSV